MLGRLSWQTWWMGRRSHLSEVIANVPRCPYCGTGEKGAVRCQGTHGPNGRQRFECVRCMRLFSETTGDPLAGFRHAREDILMAADRHLREKYSIRDTALVYGVSWATVKNWVRVVSDNPPLRKEAEELANAVNDDLGRLFDLVSRARMVGLLGVEEYRTFLRQAGSDEGVDSELLDRITKASLVVDVLEDLTHGAGPKPKK